jgi:hypothetical protein
VKKKIEGLSFILLDVCVIVTNENIPCLGHCVWLLFTLVILLFSLFTFILHHILYGISL